MSIQSNADRSARTDTEDTRSVAEGAEDRRLAGLTWRTSQLADALETGGTELDPDAVAAARAVVDTVGQRASLLGERTVVALAGATGGGKSSLFNLLVGEQVAEIGARRPTTADAGAAIWGEAPATELLDWLGVPTRHRVAAVEGGDPLDGLLLLDLPDTDSRALDHRVVADRVLERVDVLVWVTDPQKYADARLHEDYLRALTHHEAVLLVVLNQVDRLPDPGTVETVVTDLRRLLASDGVADVPVLTTSARTMVGIGDLRERLATMATERTAAERRLRADLTRAAERVRDGVAGSEPGRSERPREELVSALARAAGVPVVLSAVERDHRRQALRRTGWPFIRWARGLRPDPLRRLNLGQDRAAERAGDSSTATGDKPVTALDVRRVIGRSSLPPPSPAARAAVDLAVRSSADRAAAGLPQRWVNAVHRAASPDEKSLASALDRAVSSTPLRADSPLWWTPVSVLQRLFAGAALVGAGWLLVLVVLGWLQLPNEAPTVGEFPLPTLLLLGGVLLGIVLGVLSRAWAQVGARRRRQAVEKRLTAAIATVAQERVEGPVQDVLARHRQVRHQLEGASSR